MQACVAAPNTPPSSSQPDPFSSRFSIEGIKQRREAEYAQKLEDLNRLNPAEEVKKALKSNSIYLLGYQSGKGGSRVTPGLVESQAIIDQKCRVLQLDGMGDSIYGANHLKYRIALQKYASQFNALMFPNCSK
jgi:hypothetical protein